jgi:ferredoxin
MSPQVVITEDCAGTGQCVAVAPDLFQLGDDGLSTVIGDLDSDERLAAARKAAGLCPMAAILIDP